MAGSAEERRVALAGAFHEIMTRHDVDKGECSQHEGLCCPVPGCTHEVESRQHHHADVLSALIAGMSTPAG